MSASSVPPGALAWEEAPPGARAAWSRCAHHHHPGGDPPPVFTCAGWVFVLGDEGKRYYPGALSTNPNGLTFARWLYAAGFSDHRDLPAGLRGEWLLGVDPAEYRAASSRPRG